MGDPLRNRNQLRGKGAEKAMERIADDAWEAGFKAGVQYAKSGAMWIDDVEKIERITNAR